MENEHLDITAEHALGVDFEPVVLSCALTTPKFWERYHTALVGDAFSDPNKRFLLDLVREHWERFGVVPSVPVLRDVVSRSGHSHPGNLLAALDAVTETPDAGYVAERLLSWLRWRQVDLVLSDPSLRKDPALFATEIQKAARAGDQVAFDYTKLDEDKDDEHVQGEAIATPWEWLNGRLLGGPQKKDFCVALTVINGGKTTLLVNIAGHAASLGYNVVFGTFEDGEAKIKRRLLQWINGWTIQEIISNLAEARARRDEWIEATGGSIHIKQLKSRRTTVDEWMSFIRSVQDSSGRPVDLVITDYADRLRPTGNYNEPRHGLREVYEDCKYLASELDVLHWSASQSNTRIAMGKEVVGIESGAESTGKFESCDIAVGYGQTLEDQKLGRLTMYTSKMRDANKQELCPLIAKFDIQRVYESGNELMRR